LVTTTNNNQFVVVPSDYNKLCPVSYSETAQLKDVGFTELCGFAET
jgi:hypothetical protein